MSPLLYTNNLSTILKQETRNFASLYVEVLIGDKVGR